jgi:hypothetical protein
MTATPATPIQSVVYGTDADLIAEVARLYLKPEHRVADLTWGKGTFWKKVDHPNLIGSDANPTKAPGGNVRNFMATGYDDASFDVVVFDQSYAHTGRNNSQVMTRAQYGLESVASFNNRQILNLYRGGLEECWRIVRPGGQVWVKTKDEVESGKQRWNHVRILEMAEVVGFYGKDLFHFLPQGRMVEARWGTQRHARKNIPYLWVLERPKARRRVNARPQQVVPALATA